MWWLTQKIRKMEEENRATTIRVLSNTAYRFNFLKFIDKFRNQDAFLNFLLDLYEDYKQKLRKKKQRREKRRVIKKE